MLILLSPAKSLNLKTPPPLADFTLPEFMKEAKTLVDSLKTLSPEALSSMMRISEPLAELNYQRFQAWKQSKTLHFYAESGDGRQADGTEASLKSTQQSIFLFQGDVYTGLDAMSLNKTQIKKAQSHLRILSGLYGLLKPLDLVMAYRLEMGTKFKAFDWPDLYTYWGEKITRSINEALAAQKSEWVINLASQEYYKSVKAKQLKAQITTPVFKDFKNGQYKIISFYAKKARGLMSRYCLEHSIQNETDLLNFNVSGYYYSKAQSKAGAPVFLRES